jgi:hypothetical protein
MLGGVRCVHSQAQSSGLHSILLAQYQQSPILGGTIIKRKWLTTYVDVNYQSGDRVARARR